MKKILIGLLLAAMLVMSLGVSAMAADDLGGTVTFDGKALSSNYSTASLTGKANGLLPGDEATIEITLKNNDPKEDTDWWMSSEILRAFEDSIAAAGGAYSYHLEYIGPSKTVPLYDSETLGGEKASGNNTGLKEVNGALKNYLYLDTLKPGQTATVRLKIGLDGETEGNTYQNKMASLRMNFGVELTRDGSRVVRTGDNTDMMPYVIGSAASGLALLIVAIVLMSKKDRKPKEGSTK